LGDFSLTLEARTGDIVIRSYDGVLEARFPGMLNEIVQGFIAASQERAKNPSSTFGDRVAAAREKINGIR
jgi:hypothetical protein